MGGRERRIYTRRCSGVLKMPFGSVVYGSSVLAKMLFSDVQLGFAI